MTEMLWLIFQRPKCNCWRQNFQGALKMVPPQWDHSQDEEQWEMEDGQHLQV